MRRALTYARDFDALIVHHTEDPDLVGEGVMNEGEFAARLGLAGVPTRPRRSCSNATCGSWRSPAAATTPPRVTCAESLDVLRRAKDAGLRVTASASINHLTLNEIDIGPYRTFFKLSPPLRAEDDRAALVAALASGLIDVVMSDHDPQDVETKRLPFAEAATARSASRPCWRRGCASSIPANCDHDAAQGDVDTAGRTARPAGRHAAAGQRRPT